MQINPMSEEFAPAENTNRTRYLTAGKRVLAPVGFYRWNSSKKGTPCITIGFVCVQDLDGSGEEGAVTTRDFWITERSISMLAKFFRALGVTSAFDTDSDDDLDKALSQGYVQSTLKTETYTKSDGSEGSSTSPVFFDPSRGEQPEWEDTVRELGDWFDGYVARKQERAAQYSNNNAAPAAAATPAAPFSSDDVPF